MRHEKNGMTFDLRAGSIDLHAEYRAKTHVRFDDLSHVRDMRKV